MDFIFVCLVLLSYFSLCSAQFKAPSNLPPYMAATDRMVPCFSLQLQNSAVPARSKKGLCPAPPKEAAACVWSNCRRGCHSDYHCARNQKCCYAGCNSFVCTKAIPEVSSVSTDLFYY